MKILHTVEFYYPSVGGSQEVVKQLSERLVAMGHDVTVATTGLVDRHQRVINGVKIRNFEIRGNMVRGYTGNIKKYQDFLLNSKFEVMMNYAAQEWTMDLALPLLTKIKTKKVMVPCGFSGLYDSRYQDYFEQMVGWMKQYDALVFLSRDYRDVNFAKSHQIKKWHIIPNGAGANEFENTQLMDIRKSLHIPKNHFLILTVGSHSGTKGHNETIEAFKQANIPHATLLVVANRQDGGCFNKCRNQEYWFAWNVWQRRKDKQILVKELSRSETIAAFHAADLFVLASNIEYSPLVLFEAAASQTAFLTTDVGNAKEIISWLKGGVLIPTQIDQNGFSHPDIADFAHLMEELHSHQAQRRQLGLNGYNAWKNRYTWEKISKQYEVLYQSLLR